MLSCQYGAKSLRNVSNTLLEVCHEELRPFWRQKGVQPFTVPNKVAGECIYSTWSKWAQESMFEKTVCLCKTHPTLVHIDFLGTQNSKTPITFMGPLHFQSSSLKAFFCLFVGFFWLYELNHYCICLWASPMACFSLDWVDIYTLRVNCS